MKKRKWFLIGTVATGILLLLSNKVYKSYVTTAFSGEGTFFSDGTLDKAELASRLQDVVSGIEEGNRGMGYQISLEDCQVYVANREVAKEVVQKVILYYVEQSVETGQSVDGQQCTVEVLNTDGGQSVQEAELIYRTVEEIQLSDRLEITQVSLSDQDIFSTEEAVHAIIDEMDRLGEGVSFVEYSTWQGTYQEEPVVETTDTLFQVETELLSEGVPGTLEYTTVSQFQNGLETDTEVEEATVLQQGTPAVMLQGSLECPDYQWPVTERWITSGFGERWEEQHKGLDIGVVTGTSVCAAAAGEVLRAETIGTYGKCIIIDHGNGQETRYAHLSEILVEPGDTVSAGQEIGLSGNTGNSTGPHLHFEIRVDGEAIDPLRLLPE